MNAVDDFFSLALRHLQGYRWTSLVAFPAVIAVWSYLSRRGRRNRLPLPPGPKPYPLIGNLPHIPRTHAWEVYKEMSKEYGDVIYLEAVGQRLLVLNSLEAVEAFLVKRPHNYSDRINSPPLNLLRLDDDGWSLTFFNYGQKWRDYRRALHQEMNQNQVYRYHRLIQDETVVYLRNLLSRPEDFRQATKYLFGNIIMRVSYGAEDPEYNKELIDLAEKYMHSFSHYTTPGRLLVGTFHFLQYVPSWLPGASWKRGLEIAADLGDYLNVKAYADVKARIKAGTQVDRNNLACRLVDRLPDENDPDFKAREALASGVALVSYLAGVETTVTSGYGVILALAMHPEVLRKAQAEIDARVGTERLPDFSDIEHLPYIQAVVKETGRWHTVVPMSLPRLSKQDDVWNGYRIPAQTVILPNTWAILHDPKVFERQMDFNPERYLKDGRIDPSVLDPDVAAFGYGRRICPGRHLSKESLILMTTSLVACFNVTPSKDEHGNPVELKLEVESSILAVPLPFPCDITPRSVEHEALIRAVN